jgi:hypothetical protein
MQQFASWRCCCQCITSLQDTLLQPATLTCFTLTLLPTLSLLLMTQML